MTQFQSDRPIALFLAGAAAMSMLAAPAHAQSADPQELMARADANGDGDISWEEVVALRAESFDQLDRNGDGVISADDSPPRPFAGRFNDAFARIQANSDGNRDGQVTREEMLNAPAPVFERGDVDGDGVLTAEEIAALEPQNAPR